MLEGKKIIITGGASGIGRATAVLAANEQTIVEELGAVQGSPADIGGYYFPDPAKARAIMRPSDTLNTALAIL